MTSGSGTSTKKCALGDANKGCAKVFRLQEAKCRRNRRRTRSGMYERSRGHPRRHIEDPIIKGGYWRVESREVADGMPSFAVVRKRDVATLDELTNGTVRTIQRLVNDRLKWKGKGSYKHLNGNGTRGGRVEVAWQRTVCIREELRGREYQDGEGRQALLHASLGTRRTSVGATT